MASPEDTTILELSTADKLDDEIAKLRAQVDSLKRDLHLHTTTLLTSSPITRAIQSNNNNNNNDHHHHHHHQQLAARAAEQEAHKQQCLYRTCASVTAFRVQDPDPHAVDEGRVLGIRIEVMAKSRFVRPYFVMLNRPWAHARAYLRVHRHTVPACVPLSGLAARYLPPAPSRKAIAAIAAIAADDDDDDDDDEEGEGEEQRRRMRMKRRRRRRRKQKRKQDLPRFARALRRELVRYHNRVAVIGDLRKAAGLEGKQQRRRSKEAAAAAAAAVVMDPPIVDVSAADAEAKQIRIEWGDGKSGRLVMSDDGDILKMVVVQGEANANPNPNGGQLDRETVRQFLGRAVRIEEVSGHF